MQETAKALLQSKKFWIALAGRLVTLAWIAGIALTPEETKGLGLLGYISPRASSTKNQDWRIIVLKSFSYRQEPRAISWQQQADLWPDM